MSKTKTARKWSDPVRHERIIARIVECLLEAKLAEAKEAWRYRVGMARRMSTALRQAYDFSELNKDLLEFFQQLAIKPVTRKSSDLVWPAFKHRMVGRYRALGEYWEEAIDSLSKQAGARLYGLLGTSPHTISFAVPRDAFIKMSENAVAYDHLTQLPDVARTPRPRKPKRTLVQTRADKAAEAAKLWRRRLRLAKAKLEKYTKQQKYYAKKEVKE